MIEKTNPLRLETVAILLSLTFIIPALQWLVGLFVQPAALSGLIGSLLVILPLLWWALRTQKMVLLPRSRLWSWVAYLVGLLVLITLAINIHNRPVQKMTGLPRPPLEVINTILFTPLAEELVFRGLMWSFFATLFTDKDTDLGVLLGTSLLFGVEHLGYWAQTNWPLPPFAYLHALSMVAAGLVFGYLRQKSGSLAAPTLLHMLANGLILFFQS
jgi:membrane protease YdiL (CAAX protease family)